MNMRTQVNRHAVDQAWKLASDRLRAIAVQRLLQHTGVRGRCRIDGQLWPCEQARLAENHLAAWVPACPSPYGTSWTRLTGKPTACGCWPTILPSTATQSRLIQPIGRPAYLRVAVTRADGQRTEEITCDDNAGPADFIWEWGSPVAGHSLADNARTIIAALTRQS